MLNVRSLLFFTMVLGGVTFSTSAAEIQVPIDVNVVSQRVEITGYLDDEQEQYWALDGNELLDVLVQSIDADRLDVLRNVLQDRKVTRDDIRQLGWGALYKPEDLLITISVPVADRKLIEIPLQGRSNRTPPSGIPHVEPVFFSGVLNTYWAHSHNLVNTDFSASQVALRATAAVGHVTFEDGHTYYYNHFTDQGSWLRDRTRVMGNLRNNTGFLQLGDYQIETNIRRLPSGELFGLSYSYQPKYLRDTISPNTVPINLESTSLIKIRINGEEYRTLRLAAGQYNLKDLPLEQGVNEVEVSYIDQSGIEQKRFFNLVDHPQMLLAGDIETQLIYGAKQIYENNGDKSIDRNDMNAQGVFSYGLTPWWTLSSALELETDEQRYSLNQSFAVGELFLTLNGQLTRFLNSRSYNAQSQLFIDELFDKNLSNVAFSYGVDQSTSSDPLLHKIYFSSGVTTPLTNGYLSFNLEHQFDKISTVRQSASINTSYRINERISTSLNLRWQKNANNIDRSLYLSFSIPLRWNNVSVSGKTSYDSRSDEYKSELSASQYQPDYYWRASTKYRDTTYDGFDGYGKWYGDKVVLNARYSSRNESQQGSDRIITLGADTALAWAGSNLILTSPVTSSFTIVSLPDEYQEKYQLSYDKYQRIHISESAENSGQSELLIPVANDDFRTIKINSNNLDFNEELKQGEFVALGGLHSGSSHQLVINKGYFVSGYFYKQQVPASDIVGEFQNSESNQTYPFFTDDSGNFELDVLPEGNYRVHFYDNVAKSVDIRISKDKAIEDLFIDLGEIQVIYN